MKKLLFSEAKFYKSVLSQEDLPPFLSSRGQLLPEIAFIGKSNVGKSSLINHLCNQKGLAKTSGTPGKTQTLNFFLISDLLVLVDLPGYGYSKVPKDLKKKWKKAIDDYLIFRQPLKLILFLLDIRHPPTEEDLAFASWLQFYNRRFLIVFTKSDKIKYHERKIKVASYLQIIKENTGLENISYIDYSIADSHCREILIKLLDQHGFNS